LSATAAQRGDRVRFAGDAVARSDLRAVLSLTALWLAMVSLVSPVGDFPLNDDWVYARSVKAILDTGRFELLEFSLASAFPQAYWGALFCRMFGFSFTVLRFSTVILGLAGVLATYGLLRESKVAPIGAWIGAAALAANPIYFSLSLTFMTDVPFYCLAVVSLLFMVRGFQRNNDPAWLAAGIAMACLAMLTRQLGVVLLLGFALAFLRTRPVSLRTTAMAAAPLVLGVLLHLVLQHWLQAQGRVPMFSADDMLQRAVPQFLGRLAKDGFTVLVYTGFFVLPSTLLMSKGPFAVSSFERSPRFWWKAFALVLLFSILAVVIGVRGWMPFSENVLTYFGIGPLTLRDTYLLHANRPPAPPAVRAAWIGVSVLAALGTALLVGGCGSAVSACVRSLRVNRRARLGAVPVLMVVSASAFVVMIATMGYTFLDRYMLLCIPFALILVSTNPSAETTAPAHCVLRGSAFLLIAISAAFTVMATHDHLAWNRARWSALNTLMERDGIPPAAIDGGYEFNGWYGYEPEYRGQSGKSWWWVKGDDYIVASGPVPGYREIASYNFARWLLRVHSRIVVLRRDAAASIPGG